MRVGGTKGVSALLEILSLIACLRVFDPESQGKKTGKGDTRDPGPSLVSLRSPQASRTDMRLNPSNNVTHLVIRFLRGSQRKDLVTSKKTTPRKENFRGKERRCLVLFV